MAKRKQKKTAKRAGKKMRAAMEDLFRRATADGPPEELPVRVAEINLSVSLGVVASANYFRVLYAGRDQQGQGWVSIMKLDDPLHANTSIWPEWAYPVAEGAVRFGKQLLVFFNDSGTGWPAGNNITMVHCSMFKSN